MTHKGLSCYWALLTQELEVMLLQSTQYIYARNFSMVVYSEVSGNLYLRGCVKLALSARGSQEAVFTQPLRDEYAPLSRCGSVVFLALPLARRKRGQCRKLIWQQIWEAFPATLEILQ